MNRFVLACGLLLLAAMSIAGQSRPDESSLPRRGWFGVGLAPGENGVVVTGVSDGSPAASAGIRKGDIIRAIDRAAVRTPEDVIAEIGGRAGGATVAIGYMRTGEVHEASVVLRPFPYETKPGATFEYGAVTSSGGIRLRTIVSIPDGGGPFPAVMLLQGGGCGSVDVPMAADVGQPGLVRTIATRGYVTMRVEKSGVGDSEGPPCDAIGYSQELEGYGAALAALTRHPAVDSDKVYLLGISLGGVFAPVLAAATPVQGIIVYGTPAAAPQPYPGRSDRFFREFAAVDVPAAWSVVDARVLSVYGEFDELAPRDHHVRIAEIVNARRPGRAILKELKGLDHCWTQHDTMDESRGNCGKGAEVSTLADAILAFLAATG